MSPLTAFPLTGSFSLRAFFVSGGRFLLRVQRSRNREPDPREVAELCRLVNTIGASELTFTPSSPAQGEGDVYPNWVVYEAPLEPIWDEGYLARLRALCPVPALLESSRATVFLFENGVLVLEFLVTCKATTPSDLESVAAALRPIRAFLQDDAEFRAQADRVLNRLTDELWTVANAGGFGHFCVRKRDASAVEDYPTFFTCVECGPDARWQALDLDASELASELRLDVSELSSVLPSFEPDYLAIGYNAVLLFQRAELGTASQERLKGLRDLTVYCLALWTQLYAAEIELEECLAEIRQVRRGEMGRDELRRAFADVSFLRGELEGVGRELWVQSFSTWLTGIRTLRAFRERWLMSESLDSLRRDLDAVHRELLELEQSVLARAAGVFASAAISSLFIAAVTLFFTQTRLEEIRLYGWMWLAVKSVLILATILAPTLLLSVMMWRNFERIEEWLLEKGRRR